MDEEREKELRGKLTKLLADATEGDREKAQALLRSSATTFGWSLLAIGAILLIVVAGFDIGDPDEQRILLLMAVGTVVLGVWTIDRANSARRKLARRMMRDNKSEES